VCVPVAIAEPKAGASAPEVTVPSVAGVDVALASLRGKRHVPVAFTTTRTAENCGCSEDYSRFESAETVVLPISVDSVPTLEAYQTTYALRQDPPSDFKRDVGRAYGTRLADRLVSKRASFLIDMQGSLRWSYVEAALGARRDDAELLRWMGAL